MKLYSTFTRIILLLLPLISLPVSADYPIEVIQLKSRPLQEILPVIRPLIGADGSATGMGNSLVLKAAPERIGEIRKLLIELDRPPKRLLISVNKQGDLERSISGYSASAEIKSGDAQVSINSPGYPVDGAAARVRIYDTNDQRVRTAGQKVQAVEGQPAFIASGSRIPVRSVDRYSTYGRLYKRHGVELHDVRRGFYVVPRVNGDYVTLDIQQFDDRAGDRRGVINTQSTDTVVRGRLGEWISLGSIYTTSKQGRGGLGRSISTQDSVDQQIEVMVECLDCELDIERYEKFFPEKLDFKTAPSPDQR
ncbi:MAG: hypothetical protein WBN90_03650 [Gammaproteobacteria bacterium]